MQSGAGRCPLVQRGSHPGSALSWAPTAQRGAAGQGEGLPSTEPRTLSACTRLSQGACGPTKQAGCSAEAGPWVCTEALKQVQRVGAPSLIHLSPSPVLAKVQGQPSSQIAN